MILAPPPGGGGPGWATFIASIANLFRQKLARALWLWSAPTADLPTTTDLGANEGALAYDDTVNAPTFYDGSAWKQLGVVGGGAALTRSNDTNVTLTLGGSPTSALLAATSMTLGWSGQLAAGRGGTGLGSYTTGDILYASSSSALAALADVATGNALISGGVGTAPSWGKIGITTHVSGLGTGVATFLATPSSANLAAAVTDEIGTGSLAFATAWATWTPTFSTDLGDSAFSFSGSPTVNKARWCRVGNVVTVLLNIDATLNAITPNRIDVSLPGGIAPPDVNLYSPASIKNAATYETGLVRTNSAGTLLFYRANFANYGSGVAISILVSFSFEI